MMYVKDKRGVTHKIDFFTYIDKEGYVEMYVDNVYHRLKTYFRHERTWDDHMGNTPCGYYCNVPLTKSERKRVYIKW